MLSINIKRIGANNRLILTMTTIIIYIYIYIYIKREREREIERESNNRFGTLSLRIGYETIR